MYVSRGRGRLGEGPNNRELVMATLRGRPSARSDRHAGNQLRVRQGQQDREARGELPSRHEESDLNEWNDQAIRIGGIHSHACADLPPHRSGAASGMRLPEHTFCDGFHLRLPAIPVGEDDQVPGHAVLPYFIGRDGQSRRPT